MPALSACYLSVCMQTLLKFQKSKRHITRKNGYKTIKVENHNSLKILSVYYFYLLFFLNQLAFCEHIPLFPIPVNKACFQK